MSAVATAIVGGAVVGAYSASKASKRAANAQTDANMAAIDAQERQIEEMRKLLLPYVQAGAGGAFNSAAYLAANPDVAADAYYSQNPEEHYLAYGKNEGRVGNYIGGTGALGAQQDLLGLNGAGAQQSAIQGLQSSPMFTSLLQQGENSILQNASATGGLRGGNTQAALAQFSPALLAQVINDQYSKLSGITSLGQNSAVGAGNNGMQGGANISNLLGQIGSAQAGGALGQASAISGLAGNVSGGLGMYAALGGFGGRGMSSLQQARFSQTALGASGFGTGRAYGNQDYGDFI